MAQIELNRIRNGNFGSGSKAPTGWRWQTLVGAPTWRVSAEKTNGDGRRLILESDHARAAGRWSQSFRCRSQHHYRIEIRAGCQAAGESPTGGLCVRFRCYDKGTLLADSEQSYGPWRSSKPRWWRVQYRTPAKATRLEVSIGLEGLRGVAELEQVRAIPMDYVCAEPHPLSVPPWPYVYPRPHRVRTIDVVDGAERGGRLAAILRARFGTRNVQVKAAGKFPPSGSRAEAIVVSSVDKLPQSWSWTTVLRWAAKRIVVLSLPAFAQVVNRRRGAPVSLREHDQEDDTLGATVEFANFITNGLALLDVFDFSVFDESKGVFSQRQILRTAALRQFMQAESMETILSSDTNMDHNTGRPVCLYKETPGGGIVVLDCDPLLSPMAHDHQPNTAAQLLMNILGADTVSLGQLADPELSDGALLEQLRSMARQIPGVNLTWAAAAAADNSNGQARPQPAITVGPDGRHMRMFRLPGLVVRTGLDERGRFGLEGACLWVKSLARTEPCAARHATALLRQRQVVWLPFGRQVSAEQLGSLVDTARLALLVDIWPSDDNELRVIVPQRSAAYEPYFELLGPLDTQLRLGRMFGWLPAAGLKVNDLDHYAWRSDETPLKVVADATVFADKALRWPPAARRVRVEVPTVSPPSPAHSIVDSDRLALLLEWIAGLEIGLVAVNRDPTARKIRLPWRETRGEGRLISTQGKAVVLQAAELARLSQSGLRLSPGATLVVERGNSE